MSIEEINNALFTTSSATRLCKKEKQEVWTANTFKLAQLCTEKQDPEYEYDLSTDVRASEIMELLDTGADWKRVKQLVDSQVHTVCSISVVGQILLRYSEYGIEFVHKIIGINKLDGMYYLKEAYDEAKKEKEATTEETKGNAKTNKRKNGKQ